MSSEEIPLLWDIFVHPQGLRPSSADLYHDQIEQQKVKKKHLKNQQQDISRKKEMKEQVNEISSLAA